VADDDVLLGEIIVKASGLPGEKVARALAEVKKRRNQGEETDLAKVLTTSGLLDARQVERFQRDARARTAPRDEELTRTLRLAYESADPAAIRPRAKTGRYEAAAPPPRRATGRFEAQPAPPPPPATILPTVPPALVPQGRALVGRSWGSYEVLTEVARGAMGAIYRARDKRRGGQEVALKVLLQGDKADPEDVERFKREARALQKLSHPAIVRFYEYGVHEGCPFVTMDFVAGTTLESIIQGGGLSIDKGLVILEQVARAVDHAHSKGVVHRDLKPANVLIGNDNLARVTDFGLARILEEGGRLTRSGDLIGTPLYMSPEQIRGDLTALGPSSDVWSLGVTLYLLLTGEQPFGAQTIEDVAKRVKGQEPVPPRTLKPELRIHEDLEKICLTALQKDPKKRYQSAGEFANDLRAYLHGKPVLAGRVTVGMRLRRFYRSLRLRPLRILGAGAGLVLASFGVAHALGRSTPPQHQVVTSAALAALEAEVEKIPGRAPGDSERALVGAYEAVAPIDSATDSLRRARRAMGHRELARLLVKDDHEAARHLLTAATFAPADGTLSVDGKSLLEQALVPLERIHDERLAPLARSAVANVGEKNAPLLAARAFEAVGDFGAAAAVLDPSVLESLVTAQRDQAIVLRLEALLALERFDPAAADELAPAPRALYTLRSSRGRSTIGGREAALRDLMKDPKALAAAPGEVKTGLHLEWAELLLDSGRPRAAREHVRRSAFPPGTDRAASQGAVLEARAQILGRDPINAVPEGLDAIVARGTLPAPLRADAALARCELALLAGQVAAIPSDLAPPGTPSARRFLLAGAAPTVARAVETIALDLWDAPRRPLDPAPALALRDLATPDDLEACAWLYFALRASGSTPLARLQSDLARAVFAAGPLSSFDAVKLGHLLELDPQARLQTVFWREDGTTPNPAALDMVLSLPDPAVERLVAVADDRLAAVLARVGSAAPLAGDALARAIPELDRIERVLDVAERRDPFSASVRRARAALALGRVELAGVVAARDVPALLAPAAAAVLLGPFDRASLATMARACVAAGRPDAARLWAQRASSSRLGGEPTDADRSLLAVLQGATPQAWNPDELGRLALLFDLGHDSASRSVCNDLRAQLPQPSRNKELDARGWARFALAWDGPYVDGCFGRGDAFAGAPSDLLDELLLGAGCARESLRTDGLAEKGAKHLARARRLFPHALAPRAYLAWIGAMSPNIEDAADAADDVDAAIAIARARGNGAEKSHAADLAVALDEARLSPQHVFSPPHDLEPDTSYDVTAFLARFGLRQEK
jgi:hypothetical protein